MFLVEWVLIFREDWDTARTYVKRAAQDRGAVARGYLKRCFFENGQFGSVREDPEFLAVVNMNLSS